MRSAPLVRLETAAVVGLFSLGLWGCAAPRQPPGPGNIVSIPTSWWRPGDPARTALGQGLLHGSAREGCAWLGSGEKRTPLVWPHGYTARFDPLEILDESGKVVAREGDHVRFGGGLEPVKTHSCMFGHDEAFVIQSDVVVVPR